MHAVLTRNTPQFLSARLLRIQILIGTKYCICFFFALSPSIHLYMHLSICLSVCLSMYLFIYLSIYLSIYLTMYVSFYLSIHLSIYLSIFIFISLSLSFCVSHFSISLSHSLSLSLTHFLYECLFILCSFEPSQNVYFYFSLCLSMQYWTTECHLFAQAASLLAGIQYSICCIIDNTYQVRKCSN